MISDNVRRDLRFVINYFPEEDKHTENVHLLSIAEKLHIVLSDMEYKGEFANAYNKNFRIEDNVLNYFASFTSRGILVEVLDKVDELEIILSNRLED